MALFNFVISKKSKDWFKDYGGRMLLLPTYLALLSDKVFIGVVKSVENYTNQCAVKDGLVLNLETSDLTKTLGTFYNILKELKKSVDYDKVWTDYPAFLSPESKTPPADAVQEGPSPSK
jgi:hypothetical protein